MKIVVRQEVEVESRYVEVIVAVRFEDEDMPFDAPLRSGETWWAVIDLDDARVEEWPEGETLSFYMKVADSGIYRLLDADRRPIASIHQGYVPNKLLPGEYGDYLALDIDGTGKITNWLKSPSLEDFEQD